MSEAEMTREELAREVAELRQQVAELKAALGRAREESDPLLAGGEHLRALAEASPDCVFVIDRGATVRYVNAAGARVFGRRPEDLVGKALHELFPPEGFEEQQHHIRKVFETGQPSFAETKTQFPGQTLWLDTLLVPLGGETGQIRGILGISQDVTDRKRAEAALRESEELYRSLTRTSPDSVIVIDLEGRITEVSDRAVELAGASGAEEMLGRSITEFAAPEDAARALAALDTARREGRVVGQEFLVQRLDGRTFVGEVNGSVVQDAAGLPKALIVVTRDVTARQEAAEALRHSEAEKQAILDSMSEVVEYLDPDMRIVWANRAVAESLGRPLDQIVGRHCYAAWHGYSEPCPGCPTAKALRGGEPHEAEITSPDGRSWIVRGYPVRGAEGRIVGAVDLALDVTERKRAEQALRHRVELEEALSAISTRFINLPVDEVDGAITSALETIGRLAGVDRCVLFLLSDDDTRLRPRYHWCAEGIEPALEDIAHDWSIAKLRAGGTVNVPRVADLPPEAGPEKAYFEKRGMRSFVAVPTMYGKSLIGLLGFSSVRSEKTWAQEDIALLKTLADIFASALQRRKAEQALRESEARYRNMIATSQEGIWTVDAEGKTTFVNQRMAQMLGYSVEEIMGRSFLEFMDAEARRKAQRELKQRRKGIAGRRDFRFRRRNGSDLWTITSASPILDENSQFNGLLFMVVDISKRKGAERQVRASEARYRRLFEDSPIALWEEDFSAVMAHLGRLRAGGAVDLSQYFQDHPDAVAACAQKVRILAVNRATLDLYGARSLDDLLGGLETVFCEDSYPVFTRELVALAEGKTTFESEAVNRTLAGERKHVLLRVSVPEGEAGSCAKVLVSIVDLTEKQKLEEELLTARKLEAISLFAGGVAHDFGNLLTGVVASIAQARRSLGETQAAADPLAQAEQAALRAKGLIQQILTFSRGSAPVLEAAAVPDLVRETASLALAGTQATARFELPRGIWHAEIDPSQIGQVIQNLALNAAQAMPDGGTVEIRAANVHVGDADPLPLPPGPYVRISVADHGVGIPEENLSRIFDPFFTTKKAGSGLGLAVSYAVVQRHGGHIAVESAPGVGSTFHVYLPASGGAPDAPASEPPPQPRPTRKILLMDDEDLVRKAAAWLLRDSGYEVECAREGAEAVQLYRRAIEAGQPFDAVVLDLTISDGMGGKDCIGHLAAMDPDVRAIVCSGYSDEPIVADFARHGFRGAVVKPFAIEELLRAIEKALHADACTEAGGSGM